MDIESRYLYICSMTARIACLDLDTFFVSVERLLDPSLVGKPVVVGGTANRGVVTSCSYEVRALGVRSGMSIVEARRKAPDAIYVPPRHSTYGPYAARVKAVIERFCPAVQTASIDEFFLDFSGCEALYGEPGDEDGDATILRVVRTMRQAIQDEVLLPASVGIGTCRPIAKMASGRAKPAGVWMVRAGEERAFIDALPVRRFPGIGPKMEARLVSEGIEKLGQLLQVPEGPQRQRFLGVIEAVEAAVAGAAGGLPSRDRPAFREYDKPGLAEGSISNERTFFADVEARQLAQDELHALVERVAWRARTRGVRARTLTLKLRHADFETLTRARSLGASADERVLFAVARELLDRAWDPARGIRLLGVGLSHLEADDRQLPLFPPTHTPAAALDAVRKRFGFDAIRLGSVEKRAHQA